MPIRTSMPEASPADPRRFNVALPPSGQPSTEDYNGNHHRIYPKNELSGKPDDRDEYLRRLGELGIDDETAQSVAAEFFPTADEQSPAQDVSSQIGPPGLEDVRNLAAIVSDRANLNR